MTARRRARLAGSSAPLSMVPPEPLHYFRYVDWLTPEELADRITTDNGLNVPRRYHEVYSTYRAARDAWCAERGLKPYEIYRYVPPRVAVDGGGR